MRIPSIRWRSVFKSTLIISSAPAVVLITLKYFDRVSFADVYTLIPIGLVVAFVVAIFINRES